MRILRFKRAWPPYNGGELAGFDDEAARKLVEKGVAEYFATPDRPAPAPESTSPAMTVDVTDTTDTADTVGPDASPTDADSATADAAAAPAETAAASEPQPTDAPAPTNGKGKGTRRTVRLNT